MSSFFKTIINTYSGETEKYFCIDNYFGHYEYGYIKMSSKEKKLKGTDVWWELDMYDIENKGRLVLTGPQFLERVTAMELGDSYIPYNNKCSCCGKQDIVNYEQLCTDCFLRFKEEERYERMNIFQKLIYKIKNWYDGK